MGMGGAKSIPVPSSGLTQSFHPWRGTDSAEKTGLASFRLASIQSSIVRYRAARGRRRRGQAVLRCRSWIYASDSINDFASVMLTYNLDWTLTSFNRYNQTIKSLAPYNGYLLYLLYSNGCGGARQSTAHTYSMNSTAQPRSQPTVD